MRFNKDAVSLYFFRNSYYVNWLNVGGLNVKNLILAKHSDENTKIWLVR